jgi:hypothetical protein
VFFPQTDFSEWALVSTEDHLADQRHAYPFSFETWERPAPRGSSQRSRGPRPGHSRR